MRLSVIVAAMTAGVILAGCDGATEPQAPPTSEDALTTSTPSDDAAETSDSAPTTSKKETEEPEADGPPKMPKEAKEQSEAGAKAFVEHYIEMLSAVHQEKAEPSELGELAADGCKTCAGFEQAAEKVRFGHDYMRHVQSSAVLLPEEARVETRIEQVEGSKEIDTVFTLGWEGDRWRVSEIQLSAN